jgi:serine/threonine-protein kinase
MASPDLIGKEIAGRYRIQAKLGEGGMGAVYKAEQISLKRTCAIKLLRPDVAGTAIRLRRFNAEAEAVAKLSHPNTVNIYDFGQDTDGTLFIAMEFVEGKSLREVIHTDAPLPIQRSLLIASQVAASLVDAHGHSIIHRDLKPDNVMLQSRGRQRDVARVLDFGIAKLRDEGRATQAAMTQAGDMLGTPQYMAPEQIRAEQIDGRTDIYALGCMLYEMVTARLPFEGPTIMSLLSKHLTENPPPPSQRRPDLQIPPMIDELIMTAIAKDPNARPPTMEALGEKINAILATMPATSNQLSAVQSAVVGVPIAPTYPVGPPPGVPTPHGAYQGFAPHTPPPGQFQPTPPPMAGYGTPQAAYSPYAQPPGPVKAGGGNTLLIIIVVAILALAGVGVAVFFVTRPDTPTQVAASGDAGAGSEVEKGSAVEQGSAVEKDDDDDDDDGDGDGDGDPTDTWGGGTGAAGTGDLVAQMESYKNRMCACQDTACAVKVGQDMQTWSTGLAKRSAELAKIGAAGGQRMADLGKEFAECTTKAMNKIATTPTPPPTKDINAQIEQLANRACRCTNETCGRKVLSDLLAFVRANTSRTDGNQKRAEAAGRKLGECLVTKAGMDKDELMTAFQALGGT